ncbi:transcription factor RSL3-like [Amaranthus tricolor]|uniref:transcription factor RSL3-like n=1 Tax=Amaranthus tricolor TaxID=29722 RepID=UPI002586D4EE|nr:transcription factor RSL3-like [Amaranthus tricolor]
MEEVAQMLDGHDICMINQTNFESLDYAFSSGLDHVLGNVHQGLVEDDESLNYLGSSYTPLVTQDNLEEAPPKKKARLYKDNRGKKSIEFRKEKEENESNSKSEGEILEDESKTTQESNEPKSWASKETCKGKKRASRGAATDPQSLYARRRREKINERLRILQNLIPNGTKVDISTMLEEASHYVKFLQLQIQLLSSDELWMYAPIAYNGVDITHYKRISPFLLS